MKKINAKQLTLENFTPYGSFISMLNPDTPVIGEEPVEFYRDMIQLKLSNDNLVSASTCLVKKREKVVDCIEYHSNTGEGILPLDGNVIIHVLPAAAEDDYDINQIEAFIVPQGTLVSLNPGVWHYAPFTVDKESVNVLILLPERTYVNDTNVKMLSEKEKVLISEGDK